MANDKPDISAIIVAAFVNISDDQIILCGTGRFSVCQKKNLNASTPSEHLLPYRAKKVPGW